MKSAFCVLLICLFTASYAGASPNVEEYLKKAAVDFNQGDLEAASENYTKALQLDPANEKAFTGRAMANAKTGNIKEALADFNRAIEINPKNANNYHLRAMVKGQMGDTPGAMMDYNRSIELDPHQVAVYRERASLEFRLGKLKEAIADDSKVIALEPKNIADYYNRAQARYMTDQFELAAGDFREAIKNDPAPPRIYKYFFLWVAESKVFAPKDASHRLKAWLASEKNAGFEAWSLKVADFLTGSLDEKTFLAAAPSPDPRINCSQQCEAWYYAGIKRLREGEAEVAADYFRKCLATKEAEYREYQLAEFELGRLK